eukprot:255989_1
MSQRQFKHASQRRLRSYYKPLSVVPYITEEDPRAKWSCRCISGPEKQWNKKGNEVLQCDACNVYSHICCYELNNLNKHQLSQYFHVCDNCKNNQLQNNILQYGLIEWVLNTSNHPKPNRKLPLKESLFKKWINYGNKYFSLHQQYNPTNYTPDKIYKRYRNWFKNDKMKRKYGRQIDTFRKEINAASTSLDIKSIYEFDNIGQWFVAIQKSNCMQIINENWLKNKFMNTDKTGIDLIQEEVQMIDNNNNNNKRRLLNKNHSANKRQRIK